jgi:hypothetical protein
MPKLPVAKIPHEAIVFAVELLGAERAKDYLVRRYEPDRGGST